MNKQYKDIRSIQTWLTNVETFIKNNKDVHLYTYSSLTPDKIKEYIKDAYIDPQGSDWVSQHYSIHQHPINKDDHNDLKLISIILFLIDHIIGAKQFASKSFDERTNLVTIHSKELRKLYDDGRYISHVVAVAQAASIIGRPIRHSSPTDGTDGISRRFMINPIHSMNPANSLELVRCPDSGIARKILGIWKGDERRGEMIGKLRENRVMMVSFYNLCRLSIDFPLVSKQIIDRFNQELSELNKKKDEKIPNEDKEAVYRRKFSHMITLNKLASDDLNFKFLKMDKNGRVHSNLTTFPRVYRKFLYFKGCQEGMVMVDMANAQPFLLINLIMEFLSIQSKKKIDSRDKLLKFCQKNNHEDVIRYLDVVESGSFYMECYRLFKGNKQLRPISPQWKERVREMIYTSAFFGDGQTKWKAAQSLLGAFAKAFPTVMETIQHFKKDDSKELSNRLQREESKLFIDDVLTKLIVRDRRPNILSLHDGIFCPEGQVDHVIEAFGESFSKSGLRPRLKLDYYGLGKSETIQINP